MIQRVPALAVCTVACALASLPRIAGAEEPFANQIPPATDQAPDDLSGHLLLAPRLAWVVPTGSAEDGFPQRRYVAAGPGLGLDAAFGVSKYVAIQARFDWASFDKNADCPKDWFCTARSTAFGLGVEYHLVNGAAFDPWLAAGFAWRHTSFDLSAPTYQPGTLDFTGIDWIHFAVGGEWYPTRLVGFGPFLGFDLGTYSSRPGPNTPRPSSLPDQSAIHSFFTIGVRGVFSPMR